MKKHIILLALAMLCASCNYGNSTSNSASTPGTSVGDSVTSGTIIPVSDIQISLPKDKIAVDEEITISITILPLDATNQEYDIEVADPTIVSVEKLKVCGLKEGKTQIIVKTKDGSMQKSIDIEVTKKLTKLEEKDYLKALDSTIYQQAITADVAPHFAGDLVGIDEEDFNKERYEVIADAHVYIAEDYGIRPGGSNNSGSLMNLLESIKSVEGPKIVKFANATYEFGQTITCQSISDLYLVGEENTTFMYGGWISYMRFSLSKNVHINNITFDMNPSPTITGTVAGVVSEDSTSATVAIAVGSDFDMTKDAYANWASILTGSYAEYIYDEKTQEYVPDINGNLFYSNGISSGVKGILDMTYDRTTSKLNVKLSKSFGACRYKTPKVGVKVAIGFTVYNNFGFLFTECENTYMENITSYVAAGMGIRTDLGKNLYLNKVRFMRDVATDRLLTCTADIVHTAGLEGELIISNCILEGSHDDGINVKSFYTTVSSVRANVIEVTQTQSEIVVGFEVGEVIDVYDPSGFAYKDSYTIVDVSKVGSTYSLTLDRSFSRLYKGFLVGNATKATRMTLENTLIANKRNRGILFQGRDSVIRNCTFKNVVMGGVQILAVADVFKEAIAPRNVTVENNKFIGCVDPLFVFAYDAYGVSTIGTISDVTIQNNYFTNSINREIYIRGCEDVQVKNNLINHPTALYSVEVRTSGEITVQNNLTIMQDMTNFAYVKATSDVVNLHESNNNGKESN